MARSLASRTTAAALLSLVLVGAGASTAAARPDPIAVRPSDGVTSATNCPLRRIETPARALRQPHGRRGSGAAVHPELQPLTSAGAR
ncbi:MAG TPA: hypothetical protein VK401_10440 [Propionibacteriaceae bacterium]|jgi:hypothetical protein|nr:hypothetical protein [Propionibacteriaceae bacterium]